MYKSKFINPIPCSGKSGISPPPSQILSLVILGRTTIILRTQMKIESNELFDIPEGLIYLNCASLTPQLRAVTEAGLQAVKRKSQPWHFQSSDWFTDTELLRSLVAGVMQTSAEGIALIPSVSYGIGIAAANLPMQTGKQIVVLAQEFPSNYYGWSELARREGGTVHTVQKGDRSWTEALMDAIGEQTAIVSVPNCHWTNGAIIDLEKISRRVKSVGASLVIDASQSLGAYPIDVTAIDPDFVVSVGYKWLLGPYGLGYLYAAPRWREKGRSIEFSWTSRKGSENFATLVDYQEEYRPGARRFDMGEFSRFIHVAMATAAVRQILDWGVSSIQSRLGLIGRRIEEGAADCGIRFPAMPGRVDHLIGFELPRGVPDQLKKDLVAANIFVGYRGKSIRVSPYLYTTEADIDQLFEVIRRHL
jgi:selenocysteine lyase/cysteine desulfurase